MFYFLHFTTHGNEKSNIFHNVINLFAKSPTKVSHIVVVRNTKTAVTGFATSAYNVIGAYTTAKGKSITYKKRGYAMRIVVIKSPKFLSRLLAKIFGISDSRKDPK